MRSVIRDMKRALRSGSGAHADEAARCSAMAAAVGLLERSVRMRHGRLAMQRLRDAVSIGAPVPDDLWRYCREAASGSGDADVQDLFVRALQAAGVEARDRALP